MFTRILIPTDGTPGSSCAVEIGLEIAAHYDAVVHVLYVVEMGSSLDHFDLVVERREAEGEAAVEAVEERAQAREVEVPLQKTFRYGIPAEAILDYATDHNVDLIVVGGHEWSGLQRLLHIGRVAERIVREADIPVLVAGPTTCWKAT